MRYFAFYPWTPLWRAFCATGAIICALFAFALIVNGVLMAFGLPHFYTPPLLGRG